MVSLKVKSLAIKITHTLCLAIDDTVRFTTNTQQLDLYFFRALETMSAVAPYYQFSPPRSLDCTKMISSRESETTPTLHRYIEFGVGRRSSRLRSRSHRKHCPQVIALRKSSRKLSTASSSVLSLDSTALLRVCVWHYCYRLSLTIISVIIKKSCYHPLCANRKRIIAAVTGENLSGRASVVQKSSMELTMYLTYN